MVHYNSSSYIKHNYSIFLCTKIEFIKALNMVCKVIQYNSNTHTNTMALDDPVNVPQVPIIIRLMMFDGILELVRDYIDDHVNGNLFNIKQTQYPFDREVQQNRYFEDKGVQHYIGIDVDNHENRENLIRLHEYIYIKLILDIHLAAPEMDIDVLADDEDDFLNNMLHLMHFLTRQMSIILRPTFPDIFA